jgi:sulfite oxidase
MEHMVIGRLSEEDQELIDEQMEVLYETSEDPFAHEPVRHKALRIHSEQSMNAETPAHLLTKEFLTPNSLFYIRHHHPVPFLTAEQIQTYKLQVDLTAYGGKEVEFSLDDLKKMPQSTIITTMQCSGNRRSGMNKYKRTSGTGWGQGAISTAKWTGVRLSDLLAAAGLEDAIEAQEERGMEHVRFYALDGLMASIDIEKACSPYGDVIIAYEMNGEILPRDHGYPLRVSTTSGGVPREKLPDAL